MSLPMMPLTPETFFGFTLVRPVDGRSPTACAERWRDPGRWCAFPSTDRVTFSVLPHLKDVAVRKNILDQANRAARHSRTPASAGSQAPSQHEVAHHRIIRSRSGRARGR